MKKMKKRLRFLLSVTALVLVGIGASGVKMVEASGETCAHEHTYIMNDCNATCNTLGYTGDTYCEDCGELVASGEEIGYTEHAGAMLIAGTKATCTEDGSTDGLMCPTCSTWITEPKIIEAQGHICILVLGQAPTCQQEGLSNGEYCEVCNTWVTPQETLPLAHVESEWLPYGYDQFARVTREEKVCTVCGIQLDTRSPAPEHTGEVIKEGYDATCGGQSGLTTGVWCEDCQQWAVPQEVIPGGHAESEWLTKYDDNGRKYEEKVCERCGLQMDLRIPFEEDDLGIDLNDSTMDALSSEFGCAGVVEMTSVLPIALVSGMMLIRRKKETSQEK